MENEEKILQLINKFISNRLTDNELEELYTILNSSEYEVPLFKQLANSWNNMQEPAEIDTIALHSSMLKHLTNEEQIKESSAIQQYTKVNWLTVAKYAAVFLIAFLSFWLIDNGIKSTNKPLKVASGKYESINQLSVRDGSRSTLTLSDGTAIILNSGSTVKYPSTFTDKSRDIYLSGEAYLDVTSDPENPFIVHVDDYQVKVLGTTLNIKAYPDENIIETTLLTGAAEIIYNKHGSGAEKSVSIRPSQKAIIIKGSNEVVINRIKSRAPKSDYISVNEADTSYIVAWKEDKLIFRNEEFKTVLIKMQRWYGLKFINKYPELNNIRITGKFDKETLEEALRALQLTTPFDYTIEQNLVTITKRNK